MTSFRQIGVNRRNASKSNGPTTEEGKQRSRCNSTLSIRSDGLSLGGRVDARISVLTESCGFEEAALSRSDLTEVEWRILKMSFRFCPRRQSKVSFFPVREAQA